MKRITISLVLFLCLLFVSTALAGSSHNYRIDWITPLTSSGGGTVSSANYTASYTVGQSVTGTSLSGDYEVCTGFWCHAVRVMNIYMPLILNSW